MPFETTLQAWYGTEAITISDSCEAAFAAWLEATANDPAKPYNAILGKNIEVFTSAALAANAFKQGIPSVLVMLGKGKKATQSGRNAGGTYYPGKRREMSFDLDMGYAYQLSPTDSPGVAVVKDNVLADVITNIVETQESALDGIGLFATRIETDAEAQRNANKRNPHRVTFFTVTLDNYSPPAP